MADEKRRAPTLNASRVLKVFIYVAVYIALRHYDEITEQNLSVPALRSRYNIVNVNPEIPHWRRQLWRALFSLPMVVEEEGRRAKAKGKSLMRDAEEAVSGLGFGGQAAARPANHGLADERRVYAQPQVYDARETVRYQQAAPVQPARGQVYDARDTMRWQAEPAAGLAPGEKLLYVAPPGQAPGPVAVGGQR